MRGIPSFRKYIRRAYKILREWLHPSPPAFEGDFASWETAAEECGKYDAKEIFEKTKASALAVRDGLAAFERDSVLFEKPEYRSEALMALLWQAARDRGNLSVLDFGGSLGSVYFQSRAYLADLPSVKWGVVEQPHYVEFGNRELASDSLRFFQGMDECLVAIEPNVVFFGAVLQYLPFPYVLLKRVLSYRVSSIVFDKLAVLDHPKDRITIQCAPSHIYEASYPAWFFSECRFLNFMESEGYVLHSECHNVDHYPLDGVQTAFKGYHFICRA